MAPHGPPPPMIHHPHGPPGRPHAGQLPVDHLLHQQRAMMQHAAMLARQNQSQLVRTFDVEEDRPVDNKKARHELTTYTIYRFEADGDTEFDDEYDQYGKKKPKSWNRIKRTEVLGLEKRMVAREIQELEKDNGTLIDKKKTLPPSLQELLERTLQELQDTHGDLFETNLAQLDRSDSKKYRDSDVEDRRLRNPKASRGQKSVLGAPKPDKKRSSKSSEKEKKHKTKNKQPLNILAYYKTAPTSNANVLMLYNQAQAKTQYLQMQMQAPFAPQPDFYQLAPQGQEQPPNPASLHHEGHPKPPGGGGPVRGPEGGQGGGGGGGARMAEPKGAPPARGLPGGDQQPPKGPPANGQPVKQGDRPGNPVKAKADERPRSRPPSVPRAPIKVTEAPRPNNNRPSPPSSPESKRSFPSTDQDSETSWSSVDEEEEHRGRSHGRKPAPGKGGFHGHPEFFVISEKPLPHQARRFSQYYPINDPPGGLSQQFSPQMQMGLDLENIRAEAYHAGRADAQRDARELVSETLAQVTVPQLPQPRRERIPPRILNGPGFDGQMGRMALIEDEYEIDDRRPRYVVPVGGPREPGYRGEGLRRESAGFDDRGVRPEFRVRRAASLDDQYILVDGEYILMKDRGRDDRARPMRAAEYGEYAGSRNRDDSRYRTSPTRRDVGDDGFAYGTSRAPPPPPPRVGAQGPGRRGVGFEGDDDDYVLLSKVPGRV